MDWSSGPRRSEVIQDRLSTDTATRFSSPAPARQLEPCVPGAAKDPQLLRHRSDRNCRQPSALQQGVGDLVGRRRHDDAGRPSLLTTSVHRRKRKDKPAKALMERHILSALDDILRYGIPSELTKAKARMES
jgi:hypothetical protein